MELPVSMRPFLPLLLLLALVPVPFARTVVHTFERPPINARGATSLEDFRGRPVLLEFWGTR